MAPLVAMVVAAVLGGGGGLGVEGWQPRMAGAKTRLRSRRLVQGEAGITRAIQEVRLGLEEDTEELIVPEWFEGFGDKEVVDKKLTKEPVKDWQGSGWWIRPQPTRSKVQKKKSPGSGRLNLLTRNKDENKDRGVARGGDARQGQVMSIVKRRRRPAVVKKEETLRGAAHDSWAPRVNGETTMAPSTYQDFKTSVIQPTKKDLPSFGLSASDGNVHSSGGGGFQDFFPPRSPQELFGLEASGGSGHHAKRCKFKKIRKFIN